MIAPHARAGRPRDADATVKVLNATLQLLDERGPALRIDDIARVSGVAKTTIYRRWPSLPALVVAAMQSALGPRPLPETGDVEADFRQLIRLVHQSISHTPFVRALPMISAELMQHPGLAGPYRARIIDPVRDHAIHLIQAGIQQGLFQPGIDPSLVVDAVISPRHLPAGHPPRRPVSSGPAGGRRDDPALHPYHRGDAVAGRPGQAGQPAPPRHRQAGPSARSRPRSVSR